MEFWGGGFTRHPSNSAPRVRANTLQVAFDGDDDDDDGGGDDDDEFGVLRRADVKGHRRPIRWRSKNRHKALKVAHLHYGILN